MKENWLATRFSMAIVSHSITLHLHMLCNILVYLPTYSKIHYLVQKIFSNSEKGSLRPSKERTQNEVSIIIVHFLNLYDKHK